MRVMVVNVLGTEYSVAMDNMPIPEPVNEVQVVEYREVYDNEPVFTFK